MVWSGKLSAVNLACTCICSCTVCDCVLWDGSVVVGRVIVVWELVAALTVRL